jgi:hypothetical protein
MKGCTKNWLFNQQVPFDDVPSLPFGLGKLDCDENRKIKAMRLTRNEHHRKLRVLIRDNSDWLVNALPEDTPPFVPPRLLAASHTTCCLRL